jgi:DMSO/TMAO reductase YedYZ molybdopterin-dependent catalytic subunit
MVGKGVASEGVSRRSLLQRGAALTALGFLPLSVARAFSQRPGEEVLPWLDQPAENPVPEVIGNPLIWEEVDSWLTPSAQFFSVSHYGVQSVSAEDWRLTVGGMVENPITLTLDELRARARQEVDFTLECSGNNGLPFFWGGVGNARWAGTPLAPLLEEAGVQEGGVEVVFYGRDIGELEVREIAIRQPFARSMSLDDAMNPNNLLVYEMNGEALPEANGFPVRLITPGWYGVANVKWLERIEVRPTRYMGHFMAREYVTIREEERNGETVWAETSVGPALIKSVPARVVRSESGYRVMGAAWGADIERVEVQIDGGEWQLAKLGEGEGDPFTWTFWELAWDDPGTGEHDVRSRAVDTAGNVQPAPSDPVIANKHTYWESNEQVTRRVRIS